MHGRKKVINYVNVEIGILATIILPFQIGYSDVVGVVVACVLNSRRNYNAFYI